MQLTDVTAKPLDVRLQAANVIRELPDVVLPALDWFNTDPCERHASLEQGQQQVPPCRRCGIRFRKHQRVGIAWLYVRGRGLIADQMGTGKTAQAAGLIAALKQNLELDERRVVVICRAGAVGQWHAELRRFLPRLDTATATGTRTKRLATYQSRWDILVFGQEMFTRDHELLDGLPVHMLVVDDVDALRNRETRTAYAIKRLAYRCERAVVLTGTPLQKRLQELHSILELVCGLELFGSLTAFKQRYVREDLVKTYSPQAGRYVMQKVVSGYKNIPEFIEAIRPLTLRRTPKDIDDVDLPVIHPPNNVYLDLYPAQRERYNELRRGVLRIIKAEGATVKQATAMAQFLYGQQICDGLATLGEPDGPRTSTKLDWVEAALTGDLAEEKAIVFCRFINTVEALRARLSRHGIGQVVFWGQDTSHEARAGAVERFWDDPRCRVLIGTSAIEQSLNLQVSRHLICVDQIMNPARMAQLAGRIRRDGSPYKTVYVHNLLTRGTQEESYMDVLAREQAIADAVWGEQSQLYEALSPLALLHLIGNGSHE